MKYITSLLLPLILGGCTTEWVKKSADAEDLSSARIYCEEIAEQKYPVKNEVATKTQFETVKEKCTDKKKCDGQKYKEVKRPITNSSVIDVNEDSRDDWFMKCMEKKGWHGKLKLLM